MSLADLRPKLHSLPDRPDWIPYRTSYYAEDWGFCLSHRDLERLTDESYEVVIDSSLEPGRLDYGELVLPGSSSEEILFSAHACHPSLANDNLSGLALLAALARLLARAERRYTYRFLFVPGTIGAIAWLARNEPERIRAGLTVACVGDAGPLTYKKSRRGDAEIDRAAQHVLRSSGEPHGVVDFSPYGYDERQYNSPGFNLPVGSLTRTPHGRYPEYHTSADDVAFVRPASLASSLRAYLAIVARARGQRPVPQHAAPGRAPARPPRALPGDRRAAGSGRAADGDALGPQPIRRRPHPPRDRGSRGAPLRPHPRGRRRAPGPRTARPGLSSDTGRFRKGWTQLAPLDYRIRPGIGPLLAQVNRTPLPRFLPESSLPEERHPRR